MAGKRWISLGCVGAMLTASPIAPLNSRANAQQVRATFRINDAGVPSTQISRRSVDRYASLLSLDQDQRTVVAALHEGYTALVRAARSDMAEAMRALQREAQETMDFTIFSERTPAIMREHTRRSEAAEAEFFEDLRMILSAEQDEQFQRVERMRRREKGLADALVSGSGVDLIELLHETGLGHDRLADMDELILAYERDLDRELVSRFAATNPARRPSPSDPQAIAEMMRLLQESGERVRDINRRHARAFEQQLDEPERERFNAMLLQRSFPQVYSRAHASRIIDAALEMADLTPEQHQTIAALRETYEREAAPVNARWAAEIEKSSPNNMVVPGGILLFGDRADDDSPLAQARRARRELDRRIEDRVLGVLTEDQASRLPAREPEGPRDFGMPANVVTETIIIGGG